MTGEPRYFLTAYGIAVKHGYQGTEEEWLASLTAYGMAVAMGYEGTPQEWLERLNDPVPEITIGKTETLPAGLPATVTISGSKERPVFSFGIPRGEGTEDALMATGGTMSGVLSMGNNRLTDIPDPSAANDAVNKKYADSIKDSASSASNSAQKAQSTADSAKSIAEAALPKSGGSMTGGINMGGKSITKLASPSADTDAVNKGYVDSKYNTFSATLSAGGWTGSGPYTQTVAVSGVLQSDRPHVGLVPSDDTGTALAQEESWGYVSRGVTADGSITFTCYEDKPEVNLPLQIEVNR